MKSMLNMLQMDIFRLFKTKSLYVIYIIMFAIIVLSTMLIESEMNSVLPESAGEERQEENTVEGYNSNENRFFFQEVKEEEQSETMVGIIINPPIEEGMKVTVYDMMFGNIQGNVIILFMVIFAVLFATADMSSGYIKNFAGQVRNRWKLVLSKAIVLFLFTVLTMLLYLLMQIVSNFIAFRYLEIGNLLNLLSYIGIQTILHFGLVCVCMGFAIIFRNNLWSMSLSICICFGLTNILYSYMDKILAKIGIENFNTVKYTITGRIGMLPMNPTESDAGKCILVAVMFILVFVGLSSFLFQKRDI